MRRRAFTIVELLVATALIVFIMAILSEAFATGLATFRQLKAIGDMQKRLRTAATFLRRDLQANHFVSTTVPRGPRLSDCDLRTQPPPDQGYFRIWQDQSGTTFEGNESVAGSVVPSYRSTKHVLQFTCQLTGPERENYHSAPVPPGLPAAPATPLDAQGPLAYQSPGTMVTPWYEVSYFLKQSGDSAGTTTLYTLYLREQVISTNNSGLLFPLNPPPPPLTSPYDVLSVSMDPGYHINIPADVTQPYRRFGMQALQSPPVAGDPNLAGVPTANVASPWLNPPWSIADEVTQGTNDSRAGDDILLTDVISFDIKVVQQGWPSVTGLVFTDLPPPTDPMCKNSTFQTQNVSVFDTWSAQGQYTTWQTGGQATSLPLAMRILAIKITLRVWDARTEQSREVTVVQDM
jgi:type II secretory pathway pseudopilin PulG